jgi:hypothetical protein
MPRFTAFRGSELQLRHQSWHLHRALAPEGCVLLQPDSRVYRPGAESLSDGIPRLQYDAESSQRGYKVGSSSAPLHGDKSTALDPCNAAPVHYHGRVKGVRMQHHGQPAEPGNFAFVAAAFPAVRAAVGLRPLRPAGFSVDLAGDPSRTYENERSGEDRHPKRAACAEGSLFLIAFRIAPCNSRGGLLEAA